MASGSSVGKKTTSGKSHGWARFKIKRTYAALVRRAARNAF